MLRLEKERKKRGLNKSELARKAEISLSDYSCIERERMKPWEPQKRRLSEVLDVPEEKLFEEVEEDGNNS